MKRRMNWMVYSAKQRKYDLEQSGESGNANISRHSRKPGIMKGKVYMSEDFDAPLADMKTLSW